MGTLGCIGGDFRMGALGWTIRGWNRAQVDTCDYIHLLLAPAHFSARFYWHYHHHHQHHYC